LTFPPQLTSHKSLQVLDLYNNNLIGDLPVTVSELSNLTHLHLGGNYFTSNILSQYVPVEMDKLQNLDTLSASEWAFWVFDKRAWRNKLHGSIPEFIAELPELEMGMKMQGQHHLVAVSMNEQQQQLETKRKYRSYVPRTNQGKYLILWIIVFGFAAIHSINRGYKRTKVYDWISSQIQDQGKAVTSTDIIAYLQNELDNSLSTDLHMNVASSRSSTSIENSEPGETAPQDMEEDRPHV
ncbi:hypothetical protein M8C21_009676, partial [Ambrosia artemisiifolia]